MMLSAYPIIDAHQHFWDPATGDYPWMTGDAMAPLRQVFTPQDLFSKMEAEGVSACITVQCRHDMEETFEFLRFAAVEPRIAGVVGWVDLTSLHVVRDLAKLKAAPGGNRLVGIRHIAHDEADAGWLARPDVVHGIAAVFDADLSFDLLVRARELPAAIALVSQLPTGRFILDHMAKPVIQAQVEQNWANGISQLASKGNVWCKLSGLVTEVAATSFNASDFQPFVRHVLEQFGARRILYGSDWPVCLLRVEYAAVKAIAEDAISHLTLSERAGVMGLNAIDAYALNISSSA
jgi:L-fuconolactonase